MRCTPRSCTATRTSTGTSASLPTGRMRGNAHGYTAFFVESFIDELARRHGPRFEPPKSLRTMAAEGKTFFAR